MGASVCGARCAGGAAAQRGRVVRMHQQRGSQPASGCMHREVRGCEMLGSGQGVGFFRCCHRQKGVISRAGRLRQLRKMVNFALNHPAAGPNMQLGQMCSILCARVCDACRMDMHACACISYRRSPSLHASLSPATHRPPTRHPAQTPTGPCRHGPTLCSAQECPPPLLAAHILGPQAP